MEFGLFDHCERKPQSPSSIYKERFRVAKRAEDAGFYAYHLAEHHGTPLSLVPSPSPFLAALAQHTTKLRLGPLVYLLPLYDPYRLAQEICMLDHLCEGRLELGVGRGANPFELGFFGLSPQSARDRFDEAFKALMQGLTEARISFEGEHYKTPNAPLDIRPEQTPYPPIWYPSSSGTGSLMWAASQGFNTVVNGSLASTSEAVRAFKDNFVEGPHGPPKIGLTRYVFVADSEAEAMRVGQEAFSYHLANLSKLTRDAGMAAPQSPIRPPDDLAEAIAGGWAAVGTPSMVVEQLGRIFEKVGNNYFIFAPMIGNVPVEWGLHTIELFESEIMPAFVKKASNKVTATAPAA